MLLGSAFLCVYIQILLMLSHLQSATRPFNLNSKYLFETMIMAEHKLLCFHLELANIN